jgi:hypothetical protein
VTRRLDALTFRPATAADAGGMAAVFIEGFDTYREFAPPDWQAHTAACFSVTRPDSSLLNP